MFNVKHSLKSLVTLMETTALNITLDSMILYIVVEW